MTKNGILAVVLSIVLPGLGQIYAGKKMRGILLFAGVVFITFLAWGWAGSKMFLDPTYQQTLLDYWAPIILVLFIYFDSYRQVQKYNKKAIKTEKKVKKDKETRVMDIDTVSTETALGVLKSRFAAGDISKAEFEEKKKVLLEA